MEKLLVGQGSCNGEGKPVPLSHPFEIQVQGHEPREEWQRGPAPGQTGSHRTGPRSSSPCLAPSHSSPPRLAQAYGSQAVDPPVDRPEPCATKSYLRSSDGENSSSSSPWGEGTCKDGGVPPQYLTASPAPRPLDGGPA